MNADELMFRKLVRDIYRFEQQYQALRDIITGLVVDLQERPAVLAEGSVLGKRIHALFDILYADAMYYTGDAEGKIILRGDTKLWRLTDLLDFTERQEPKE